MTLELLPSKSMNDGEELGLTLAVLAAQPRHERAIKFSHTAESDIQSQIEWRDGLHWYSWPSLSIHNESQLS